MTNEKSRAIRYGLGAIGLATAKLILSKPDMEIVGAVDIAKEIVGRDLVILGRKEPFCVHVTDNVDRLHFVKC